MPQDPHAVPAVELERRLAGLKSRLAAGQIEAALILQRADLYYFSGTVQQAHLWVPADGEPLLLVHKSLERARRESALPLIAPLDSARGLPEALTRHGQKPPGRLGLELDVLPAAHYLQLQALFPATKMVDVSPAVRATRAVKSDWELTLMRQAAAFSDEVAAAVPKLLRAGMTELELAGRLEAEARRLGHQGIVRMRLWGNELFYGHLLAGPSGGVPSYLSSPTGGTGPGPAAAQSAGFRPIERHEPVLVDYVFAWQGYLSDHARIFSIGELPDELQAAHRAMLELQRRLKTLVRPGVAAGDIYEKALAFAVEKGYADYFMGADPRRIRFVGHGIGLELDEYPFLNQGQQMLIEAGMTVAVEPKLVFPGRGVVGVENTHLVTERGLAQLGRFPDEVCVL